MHNHSKSISAILRYILVISLFLFTACYDSDVPLSDNAESSVDIQALGYWQKVVSPSHRPASLMIWQFNEKEYLIEYQDDNSKASLWRAYSTKIKDKIILNAQILENDQPALINQKKPRQFTFFSYKINKDKQLELSQINSDFMGKTFSTSKSLRTFVEYNLDRKELFEPAMIFSRN